MSAEQQLEQAQAVAEYLANHPNFFAEYGAVLAGMTIPAPHGGRAISLHERQLEVLREKHRGMELRLAELIRIGQENDAIIEKMQRWTRQLLLHDDAVQLPELVSRGLTEVFSVPQVALRLWNLREPYQSAPFAATVGAAGDDATRASADQLKRPYCGVAQSQPARAWLPDDGADTKSMAILALRKGADPKAFGLLVLGSADADRFRAGMGTAYLERIAETASAALARLVD